MCYTAFMPKINNSSIPKQQDNGKYLIIPEHLLQSHGGCLTVDEALLFSYITRLINAETGFCWATNKHFSHTFKTSVRTIQRHINGLIKNNLITITLEKNNYRKIYLYGKRPTFETPPIHNKTPNTPTCPDQTVKRAGRVRSVAKRGTSGKGKVSPEYTVEENKQISEIIHAFAWDENALYANRLFQRKVEREAAHDLIKRYGYDHLISLIPKLQRTNRQPYFPTILSPVQLVQKYGALLSAIASEKHKQENPDRRRQGVRVAGQ